MTLIYNVSYNFEELKQEAELKMVGRVNRFGRIKPLIRREGLPQGLSISPLLATLVLEMIKPPKGLVMYADDGLHITDTSHKDFEAWIKKVEYFGVQLEESKSGEVGKVFKFLGVEFDLGRNTMNYNGNKIT